MVFGDGARPPTGQPNQANPGGSPRDPLGEPPWDPTGAPGGPPGRSPRRIPEPPGDPRRRGVPGGLPWGIPGVPRGVPRGDRGENQETVVSQAPNKRDSAIQGRLQEGRQKTEPCGKRSQRLKHRKMPPGLGPGFHAPLCCLGHWLIWPLATISGDMWHP